MQGKSNETRSDHRQTYSEAATNIMSTIARSSLDALITIDGEGNILEFGPSAETMYGYRREEVLGRPVAEIVIPERLRHAHNEGMRNYHATGEGPVLNTRVEVPSVRRNGCEFEAELTVVPLHLDGHELFMAFVRDISQQKQHEKELEEARALAEQANEAKSRFLAHMSHEIRSPLNAVLAAVELLADTPLDSEQQKFAETAGRSGSILLSLINHILDFSRIEANQQEVRYEPVDLRALLDSTLQVARAKAQANRNLLLACIDPDVPLRVETDAGMYRQMLTNLVDNAIKFTEDGVIGVTVSLSGKESEELRIEVADTGIGIPEDKLEHLFEEFIQADQTHATRYDGTGLGLAIVRRLAQLMDGDVQATSSPGVGSRFILKLPLRHPAGTLESRPQRDKVLAVLNDDLLGEMLEKHLQMLGSQVQVCRPAQLARLDGQHFDQVIVDARAVNPLEKEHADRLRSLAGTQPLRWLLRTAEQATVLTGAEAAISMTNLALCSQLTGHPASTDAPQGTPKNTGKPEADRPLAGTRLLLVEDSMANQLVATAILQKAGAEVHLANNGREALENIGAIKPHLVLMDLRMPEVDGITATGEIRRMAAPLCDVRILALTANAVQAEIERCLAAGMNDYITKPIEGAVLIRKVAEWVPGKAPH